MRFCIHHSLQIGPPNSKSQTFSVFFPSFFVYFYYSRLPFYHQRKAIDITLASGCYFQCYLYLYVKQSIFKPRLIRQTSYLLSSLLVLIQVCALTTLHRMACTQAFRVLGLELLLPSEALGL